MFAKTSIIALAATAALLPVTLAQISDDFENGWSNATWPVYTPDCTGGGTVSLDSTTAHSGKNSIKVVGGSSGYCGHVFFGTTKIPAGGEVYVRTWLKHQVALGQDHVTFIVMPDTGLSGKHLRVSGQEEIIEYNRESDDATLPDLSPDGVASSVGLPTDTWECLEYHLGSDGTIETWLNSKEVTGLTFDPTGTNANANGWGKSYKPDITGVYFGWESYAGSTDTFWYDDVAVESTRIGCAVSGAATSVASTKPTSTAVSTKVPVSTTKAVSSAKPTSAAASSKKPVSSSKAASATKPKTSSAAHATSSSLKSVVKPATSASSFKVPTPKSSVAVSPVTASVKPSSHAATSVHHTSLPSKSSESSCVVETVTVYV